MHQHQEHTAFDPETHGAIQTVDFNFDDVDEALGYIHHSPPSAREQAAELFRNLATWCFRGQQLRPGLVKLIAVISGLRPDLLDNRTEPDLARELGVTKQALSRQSLKFQDAWRIKFARSRSKEGREHMAAARRGGPNRNTKLPKRSP